MRVIPFLLLAGCAAASPEETAVLDGADAEGLPDAWVVWRTAVPDLRVRLGLVVERSGRAKTVWRGPEPGAPVQALQRRDQADVLVVRRKEGVVDPARLAALEEALRAPPPPAGPYAVTVREPGGAVRSFSYAEPCPLHDVLKQIAEALPESR
jgi:hypothetical protein